MERPALPAATHDERGAVSACISRALSSLCGLRAHFTFLPCEAKTFHFCAAVYVRLPLTYIRAKISRPQPPNIVCAYFGCSAAQDIKGWSAPRSGCSVMLPALYYTLLEVQHYTLIAPQAAATSAMRRAVHGSMSRHFTCPLVALRFEGTFHVFANVLAKTFHFSAEREAALAQPLYLPKNFTSGARAHTFAYRSLRPCAGHKGCSVTLRVLRRHAWHARYQRQWRGFTH